MARVRPSMGVYDPVLPSKRGGSKPPKVRGRNIGTASQALVFVCGSGKSGSVQSSLVGKLPVLEMPEISVLSSVKRSPPRPLPSKPPDKVPPAALPSLRSHKYEQKGAARQQRHPGHPVPPLGKASMKDRTHQNKDESLPITKAKWQDDLRPIDDMRGRRETKLAGFAKAAAGEAYDRLKELKEQEWREADGAKRSMMELNELARQEATARQEEAEQRRRKEADRVAMQALWEEERRRAVEKHLETLASEANTNNLPAPERAARNRAARVALSSVPQAARRQPQKSHTNQAEDEMSVQESRRSNQREDRRVAARKMSKLKKTKKQELDAYLAQMASEVGGSIHTRLLRPSELESGRGEAIPRLDFERPRLQPGFVPGGVVSVVEGQVFTVSPAPSHQSSESNHSHGATLESKEETAAREAAMLR